MIRGSILLLLALNLIIIPTHGEPLKNLTEIGVFTTNDPHDAEFFKDYMFIADGNSLLVYKVSNPEKPEQVFHSLGKEVSDIATHGNDVYLARAYGTSEYNRLNISNPYAPIISGTAFDNSGNNQTENIQVVYRPVAQPAVLTPGKTVSPTPTDVIVKDAVSKPVSYNIILISMLFLITIALIYWIYNLKK